VNCGDRNVVVCALFEEDGAGFLDFDGTEITPFLFPLDFSFGLSELICIVSLFRMRPPPPKSFSATTTTEDDANDDDALAALTPLLDNDDLEDASARAIILLLALAGSQRFVLIKQSDSPCPYQFSVDCSLRRGTPPPSTGLPRGSRYP